MPNYVDELLGAFYKDISDDVQAFLLSYFVASFLCFICIEF